MLIPRYETDRRTAPRLIADDIIRWKRPGKVEDNKGWTVDRSETGIGFYTDLRVTPQVGEVIHMRRLDGDTWVPFDGKITVRRATPTSTDELVTIGCTIEQA
jgi:hypothetical protein